MTASKIILGAAAVLCTAVGAIAGNNKVISTYYFRNAQGQAEAVKVQKTCIPGAFGCLGTAGASFNQQLYTAIDLQTPLHP